MKKDSGKIDEVHKIVNLDDMPGSIGIGHTRWATHGAPLKVNCSPPHRLQRRNRRRPQRHHRKLYGTKS